MGYIGVIYINNNISQVEQHGATNKPNRYWNKLSNEKNPGWLVYIGDEVLPSYMGIVS